MQLNVNIKKMAIQFKGEFFKDYVLEDDETGVGGISHQGETLADFLEHDKKKLRWSIRKINRLLISAGIKPIEIPEICNFIEFEKIIKNFKVNEWLEVHSFEFDEDQSQDWTYVTFSKEEHTVYSDLLDEEFTVCFLFAYVVSNGREVGYPIDFTNKKPREIYDELTSDGKYPLWF